MLSTKLYPGHFLPDKGATQKQLMRPLLRVSIIEKIIFSIGMRPVVYTYKHALTLSLIRFQPTRHIYMIDGNLGCGMKKDTQIFTHPIAFLSLTPNFHATLINRRL